LGWNGGSSISSREEVFKEIEDMSLKFPLKFAEVSIGVKSSFETAVLRPLPVVNKFGQGIPLIVKFAAFFTIDRGARRTGVAINVESWGEF